MHARRHIFTVSTVDAATLRGYWSVSDITCDLDGTTSTYIGWVLFEVSDNQRERVRGVIGTFNDYVTLMLLRRVRDQKPCRMYRLFDSGQTEACEWTLDNVAFIGAEVDDVSGFIAFHALAFNHSD